MNGHSDIEHGASRDSSLELSLKRKQRKDVVLLIVVILLAAVLGYLLISNLSGIYNFLV